MRPTSLRSSSTVYATPSNSTTVTTTTLPRLQRKNARSVTCLQPLLRSVKTANQLAKPHVRQSIRRRCCYFVFLMFLKLTQCWAVTAENCGGEECVVGRSDERRIVQRRDWNKSRIDAELRTYIIAC